MEQAQLATGQTNVARDDRARMVRAIQNLEQALASASFDREDAWGQQITESLTALQMALRETRETADAKGGLFEELVQNFPHLQGRAKRLRKNYEALQELVESARSTIGEKSASTSDDVDRVREELARLLAKIRHTQAAETELLFEAYHVDIGVGD